LIPFVGYCAKRAKFFVVENKGIFLFDVEFNCLFDTVIHCLNDIDCFYDNAE